MNLLVALLCCNTCGLINEKLEDNPSPKIVIVGAGAAGIAAATRLYDNGFTDVTILEAENRIGGRLYSRKFGGYSVDMGAQWIHGEKNNVAFELAWPFELLERFEDNYDVDVKYFGSSGEELPTALVQDILNLEGSISDDITNNKSVDVKSFGQYADIKYQEYFENHPELNDLHVPLRRTFELSELVSEGGGNTWYQVSVRGIRYYPECEGDSNINWKNLTYSVILDILLKKYPNPDEELPILKNIHLNTKVRKISYNKAYDTVKVSTANGKEFTADHVIFTPSLGVLKANYRRMFNPPLPLTKTVSIENIGYGNVAKIYLYYDEPWWSSDGNKYTFRSIYWTLEDWAELEKDPDRRWMLGVYGAIPVEHKPNLLCLWVATERSIEMELIPDEIFRNQLVDLLRRFFGQAYNVTEPVGIMRTAWNTNEHFRGAYSYPSVMAEWYEVNHELLAAPIWRNDKPVLQFAGEATSEHFSTVHGAIESGWREADRLISFYLNETVVGLRELSKHWSR